MDYIITNCENVDADEVFDGLYFCGGLSQINNILYHSEGYLIDERYDDITSYISDGIESYDADGVYNIIIINKTDKTFCFKCDKRATISTYIYKNNEIFAISNNVWLLVEKFYSEIEVDTDALIDQLVYFSDPSSSRTLFKNIERITGASSYKYSNSANLSKTTYWEFTYDMNAPKLSLIDFVDKMDDDFKLLFSKIHKQNQGKIMGFGNSGGLDSRLIAHYATQANIEVAPYVIGVKKPNILLESTTSLLSNRVASHIGAKTRFINYSVDNIFSQLLIDIRNAPFLFSQLFINPYKEFDSIDYVCAGDPGGLLYMSDKVLSNDLTQLKEHANYFIGSRRLALPNNVYSVRKTLAHLKIKYDEFKEDGLIGLSKSNIDLHINNYNNKLITNRLYNHVESLGGNNNIERWVRCHDNITTKYQYMSGYDSINGILRTYQLYSPLYYNCLKDIHIDNLKGRVVLKQLIKKIGGGLDDIPGQNMEYIDNRNDNMFYLKKIEMAIRGRGLSLENQLNSTQYADIAKEIINRENPIYYSIVNKEMFTSSHFYRSYVGMNFVKFKLLLDIFYYKEFNLLKDLKFNTPIW